MSNPDDKSKRSRRIQQDDRAIQRQVTIAKTVGLPVVEAHRYIKKRAMDCGNPECPVCGNPRKLYKELTPQEKKIYQDTDHVRDKHSNGLPPADE